MTTETKCKTCGKKVELEITDMCLDCVEKKQPNGKFADYIYRPLSWMPKTKSEATVVRE